MAKVSSVKRDEKRRKMNTRLRDKREQLKAKIYDRNIAADERFAAVQQLNDLPRNSSRVRARNRCGLSGRPRGFYRKFRLSRIALRDLASFGLIPGVIKASW
jgi:small subunit ribosomal protein S14